jgi:hypothetical protein
MTALLQRNVPRTLMAMKPRGDRDLFDRDRWDVRADRGIVDEDVEATEFLFGRRQHGGDGFFIADIDRHRVTVATV